MLLLTKLLRDLKRSGINGPDDLRAPKQTSKETPKETSKGAASLRKAK
jgi:hypothetical protein